MRIKLGVSLTLREIAEYANATIKCYGNERISYISTDSRDICDGDLFVALRGAGENGEAYAEAARARGAYTFGAMSDADIHCLDAEDALLKFAHGYKCRLTSLKHTIGITGSVGKTTTKEFCAAMLGKAFSVHATYKNFNNALGVALSILTAPPSTDILILELGMNHRGEIKRLSDAVEPTQAIITNVGHAHIGNLGSRTAISEAKLEILSGMKEKMLFVPYEEPLIRPYAQYTYSLASTAADYYLNCTGDAIEFYEGSSLILSCPHNRIFRPGEKSALCAGLALGQRLGIERDILEKGALATESVELRASILKIGRARIFEDTYSSSPEAVREALSYAKQQAGGDPMSAALGDMLELGEHAEKQHILIGRFAAQSGCRKLYLFGIYANHIKEGAREAGMQEQDLYTYPANDFAKAIAKQILSFGDKNEITLIKASHALNAESIVDELKEMENKNA